MKPSIFEVVSRAGLGIAAAVESWRALTSPQLVTEWAVVMSIIFGINLLPRILGSKGKSKH